MVIPSKNRAESSVLIGEVRKTSGLPPKAYVPDPKLEAALENRVVAWMSELVTGSG
jgi:hypothetical protein